MTLPSSDKAVVDVDKLRRYVLSPAHLRGRHKARVFASALGLTSVDADKLREALLAAAREREAQPAATDQYGRQYIVDFPMNTNAGHARIRSSWIIRSGEDFPRFVSCFVMRRRR